MCFRITYIPPNPSRGFQPGFHPNTVDNLVLSFSFWENTSLSVMYWALLNIVQLLHDGAKKHAHIQAHAFSLIPALWLSHDAGMIKISAMLFYTTALSQTLSLCLPFFHASLVLTSMQVSTEGPIPGVRDELLLALEEDSFFLEAEVKNTRWRDPTTHI